MSYNIEFLYEEESQNELPLFNGRSSMGACLWFNLRSGGVDVQERAIASDKPHYEQDPLDPSLIFPVSHKLTADECTALLEDCEPELVQIYNLARRYHDGHGWHMPSERNEKDLEQLIRIVQLKCESATPDRFIVYDAASMLEYLKGDPLCMFEQKPKDFAELFLKNQNPQTYMTTAHNEAVVLGFMSELWVKAFDEGETLPPKIAAYLQKESGAFKTDVERRERLAAMALPCHGCELFELVSCSGKTIRVVKDASEFSNVRTLGFGEFCECMGGSSYSYPIHTRATKKQLEVISKAFTVEEY